MSSFDFGPTPRPKLSPERRGEERLRVSNTAWVSLNRGLTTRECTVRNLSRSGTRLWFEDPTGVPAVFELKFADETQGHTARVRWRSPVAVGVELTE